MSTGFAVRASTVTVVVPETSSRGWTSQSTPLVRSEPSWYTAPWRA